MGTMGVRRRMSRGLGVALVSACIAALGTTGCNGKDDLFPTGSGSGGSGAGSSVGGSGGTGGSGETTLKPAAGGARRLISRQYKGSIRTLLGDVAVAAATPPADPQLNGFETIGATDLATAASSVETYENSARAIAAVSVADAATYTKILPCVPNGATDSPCLRQFVESFGKIAWRRTLTDAEATRVTAAGMVAAAAYDNFDDGLEAAMSAILQSPYFLYIIEIGEPDASDPTVRKLTPTELMTRMTLFLLNSTPTAAQLAAAESGALDTEAGVKAAAQQMLTQPEAKQAIADFYNEVWHLREMPLVIKDPAVFPQFNDSLKTAMQEETLRLIEDVVWTRNADISETLTADFSFINPELAALYGVTPIGTDYDKTTMPAEQKRAGVLGHGSFLSRGAHDKFTSPTRRGAFVREALLCDPIPPPPPTVNPTLPDDGTPKTVKQKLQQHMMDPSCNTCHGAMDPIGFALENYDAIGQFRTVDQGFPIDSTAQVEDLGSFSSAVELAGLLSKDVRMSDCTVEKLFRQSMGHLETPGEEPALVALKKDFASGGRSVQTLLVELCASPAFRLVGDPK